MPIPLTGEDDKKPATEFVATQEEYDQIKQLDVSGKAVSNLKGVGLLKNLEKADFSNTQNIVDVNPLTSLKRLSTLYLAHNKIANVAPLVELPGLTDVSLEGNRISDITPILPMLDKLEKITGDGLTSNIIEQEELSPNNMAGLKLKTGVIDSGEQTQFAAVDTSSIQPAGGEYNPKTGEVVWDQVSAGTTYSFHFSGSAKRESLTIPFSGTKKVHIRAARHHVQLLAEDGVTPSAVPSPDVDDEHTLAEFLPAKDQMPRRDQWRLDWVKADDGQYWSAQTQKITSDLTLKEHWVPAGMKARGVEPRECITTPWGDYAHGEAYAQGGVGAPKRWTSVDAVVYYDSCNPTRRTKIRPLPPEDGSYFSKPSVSGTNYYFIGWYTASGSKWNFNRDTVEVTNTNYHSDPNEWYTFLIDFNLYARWGVYRTLTYKMNGCGRDYVDSYMKEGDRIYDSSYRGRPCPSDPHLKFSHWSTYAGGWATTIPTTMPARDLTFWANWTKAWTVSFNTNGGTAMPSISVDDGSYIGSQASLPSKTGYDLAYWTDNYGYTWNNLNSRTVTRDITLTAQWTPRTYTATFYANDGTGRSASTSATYNSYLSTSSAPTYTRNSYRLVGWATSSTASVPDWNFNTSRITGNTSLYAVWKQQATVTFDAGGGSVVPSRTVDIGMPVGSGVSNPSRQGYSFDYWATSSGTRWNLAADPVNSDMTLYAKWKGDLYTVHFDSNGGTSTQPDVQVHFGETIPNTNGPAAPAHPADRPAKRFLGWYKSPSGAGSAWNFAFDRLSDLSASKEFTLYARWSEQRTVTFDPDQGNLAPAMPSASVVVNDGEPVAKPDDPTRNGHTFQGWYTTDSSPAQWSFTTPVTANMTLKARWQRNNYNAKFHANDNSGRTDSFTIAYGSTIPSSSIPRYSRTGYRFVGWSTNPNATNPNWFEYWGIWGHTDIYAIWVQQVTVTFDTDGAASIPAKTIDKGLSVGAGIADPSKDGYRFDYWMTSAGGRWDLVNDRVQADMTVKAHFTKYVHVTFVTNGGGTVPQQAFWGDQPASNPGAAVSKPGYHLLGWYRNANFTGSAWIFSDIVADDLTLYAKWEADLYTVHFDSKGGRSTPSDVQVRFDSLIPKPTNPLPPAHGPNDADKIFLGWSTNPNVSGSFMPWQFNYDHLNQTSPTHEFTLYAVWSFQWRLTFDPNGGALASSTIPTRLINSGTSVFPPANPVRAGWFFDGWYDDTTNVKWFRNGWSQSIMRDTTLTAHWASPMTLPETGSISGQRLTGLTLIASSSLALPTLLFFKKRSRSKTE
ncbi:hypothetical protein KIMH_01690 [Bombiscardovia apis]|uniref:Internalin-A n=1 Tax=Bombiscardovia apis TaxID=2932182 RepID=A0ABM8BB00_9BIFI|nr:InlB B-repeat-containing protein [Bombiscardovia apis]BDR54058.1 hypothetical protein KIMH_01690 [Bombiscardovia apis]